MARVFGAKQKMLGELDFVTAWFKKASDTIQGATTRCALVATNSITQGQQVPVLWRAMNVEIDFAYRTFKWRNEAKGQAAVHCVIIGFHAAERTAQRPSLPGGTRSVASAYEKTIFDGSAALPAAHINGYLCDAPDAFIENRSKPICDVPPMNFGNMPRDGGNLIIEAEDYERFLAEEPLAAPLIRPLLGAEEFLHNQKRYCLWLVGANPALLQKCPKVRERIEACRQMRLSSKAAATRKFEDQPQISASPIWIDCRALSGNRRTCKRSRRRTRQSSICKRNNSPTFSISEFL